jgi:hypothetical protein
VKKRTVMPLPSEPMSDAGATSNRHSPSLPSSTVVDGDLTLVVRREKRPWWYVVLDLVALPWVGGGSGRGWNVFYLTADEELQIGRHFSSVADAERVIEALRSDWTSSDPDDWRARHCHTRPRPRADRAAGEHRPGSS